MEPTTETICDKARRLAREEEEERRQKIIKDKQAFLDQFGLSAQSSDEYHYDLCGYEWTCYRRYSWDCDSEYVLRLVERTTGLRYSAAYYPMVTDLLSLGHLVLQIDEEKAEEAARSIQAITNPKPRPSLWRRFKSWVESSFDGYYP